MSVDHLGEKSIYPLLFTHYGSDWIRGSERCLLDLITHLDRNKFKPVVWCNSHALAAETRMLNVETYQSDFPLLLGWNAPRYDAHAFFSLIKKGIQLVNELGIKLIHSNSGAPCQWLNVVARLQRLPLLVHLHSRYPFRDRLTLGLHQVAMAVGVSDPVIEQLLGDGVNPDKTAVIPNGIDIERLEKQSAVNLRDLLGLAKHDFLIVSTGSLIHRKGFDLLIQSICVLVGQQLPVHLVIVGDGPERNTLEEQAKKLGIASCVHFLGERPDVYGVLRESPDLYVSAAREEVFGLSLAEASLAGLAVVAPSVGGIPSVITEGETGMLTEPEHVNSMADAIRKLYFNSHMRDALGEAGKQKIRQFFTIQGNTRQFERLYDHLIMSPDRHMRWNSHWQLHLPLLKATTQLFRRASVTGEAR